MDIHHPEPENPPKPLIKKGDIGLELRIDMIHSGRSFVYELSVLPVAELNRLLVGSRETLTYFRVLAGKFSHYLKLSRISDRSRYSRFRLGYRSDEHRRAQGVGARRGS